MTALAEAEVEYHDHKSPSIYVKFPLTAEGAGKISGTFGKAGIRPDLDDDPWTLPANLAIALHPDFTYAAAEVAGEVWIMARRLLENVMETMGVRDYKVIRLSKRRELRGLKARHPFADRDSVIVLGTHVTLEAGTGAVHTAPGHGREDYETALEYGLDIYSPVDDQGRYTKDVSSLRGNSSSTQTNP